jgi:hypothetical protein
MLATVAVKAPVVWPGEIVAVAGTVTLALLLDKAISAPTDGAGAVKVMVQLADPGAVTVPGAQVKFDGKTPTVKLIVADCCWPLSVPVTVALWAPLTVPVVAEKVALVWPVPIVTLEGTVSAAALLPSDTIIVLMAALLSDAVHVLEALLPRLEGAQDNEESCAGAVADRVNGCDPPL